jgi:hypothetical protein
MIGQLLYGCTETSAACRDICGNDVVLVACQEAWRDCVTGWLGSEGRLGKFSKNNDETIASVLKSVCLVAAGHIVSLNHRDRQVIEEMVFGNQIGKCLEPTLF